MDRLAFTIPGPPRTKKNSPMMIKGRNLLLPSEAFRKYSVATKPFWAHEGALLLGKPIDYPVNVCCVYYMDTKRIVDLVGLLQGSLDLMVENGILKDDNARIAVSYDGSRVLYDKECPRVEVTIERTVGK